LQQGLPAWLPFKLFINIFVIFAKNTIMKNIFIIVLFVFAGALYTNTINAQTSSEIKIKTFFHCPNGQALLQKELVKVDGVSKAVADLETKIVTINYNPAKQTKESLVSAIEKIGYKTEFSSEDTKINKACSHDSEPVKKE
jgi:periplasmic mercuric ion binding protein